MPHHSSQDVSNDQILKVSRGLAFVVVPVLVTAFLILYLFPSYSGLLFAWPIKPNMSAMMLGATYLGGVYFFTRMVRSKAWHTVQLGLLPVTAFVVILGVSTVLHWDKFTHGHISFITWAFLYLVLPFVIPVVWYRNHQVNRGFVYPPEPMLPKGFRVLLGSVGAVMVLTSLMLFLFPVLMIPTWPWTLTPLMARVVSAMFILPGWVAMAAARDGHLSAARIVFGAQVVSIVFILLAMGISRADILWASPAAYAFIGGLVLVLGMIGWAFAWERRGG